jgi:hypothetical protein
VSHSGEGAAIRRAKPSDAPRLAAFLTQLGYPATARAGDRPVSSWRRRRCCQGVGPPGCGGDHFTGPC